MYIMVPTGMQIINSNFVVRFCVVEKPDAALVVASYDRSTVGAHTLGRYADVREAQEALGELLVALAGGQTCFTLPDSTLYHGERIKKDARVKRRGGS